MSRSETVGLFDSITQSCVTNWHAARTADVDGTLVMHDKTITGRSRAAVRKLGEANIAFAVTGGRPPRGMVMLLEPLVLPRPSSATF